MKRYHPTGRVALVAVLLLFAAGCASEPDETPTTAPSVPTAGPTVTVPGLGVEIDVEDFLSCLDDGGIEVEPEEEPRFDAIAEIQIGVTTSEGFENIGVFVYESADDASAAKPALDEELTAFESPPSQQVANVLVAGIFEVAQDPEAQENLGVVLACLGGIEVETPTG